MVKNTKNPLEIKKIVPFSKEDMILITIMGKKMGLLSTQYIRMAAVTKARDQLKELQENEQK